MESKMHNKPIALVILDGFGVSQNTEGNAIAQAKTPNISLWIRTMPHVLLQASGTAVGLPEKYVGNSEVGHLTIGSGRITPQSITRINAALDDGSFFNNPVLNQELKKCAENKKTVHIIGLLSDAGVHGNQEHIYAYVKAAHKYGIEKIYIHAILDGRDTAPQTAYQRIEALQKAIAPYNAHVASVHGRFYAMDRNRNYDRTRQSYNILTNPQVIPITNFKQHILASSPTEEYCEPIRVDNNGVIAPEDCVIFTLCRADRIRQLVCALNGDKKIIAALPEVKNLTIISPVSYGTRIATHFLFAHKPVDHTLKETLCLNDRTIFSIAETEKYAHITYFFNGEKEDVLSCEVRHLIPSKKVKNYIHNPEMSAAEITDTVIRSLHKDPKDFYLINYANADMVGHSGDFNATVKAVECIDTELGRLYHTLVEDMDGTLCIVGDHGNAEEKINPSTGAPSPTHTHNPVPFILVTKNPLSKTLVINMHGLADVAPFILNYMGITVPAEMTGNRK